MPVMPKRTKYRKIQKGRNRGKATRGTLVSDGEYGLQAVEAGWITSNQIEAARVAMTRFVKRGGKVWIKIFPDKPITKKPAETRMGSGKGAVEYWVAPVKPGRVMFEMAGVAESVAKEAFRLAANKLPVKTKFVIREGDMSEIASKYANYIQAEPVEEIPAENVEEANGAAEAVETEVGGDNDEDK